MTECRQENMMLYQELLQLGSYYRLSQYANLAQIKSELSSYDSSWVRYNPQKGDNQRYGLSLTSLDGGLTGVPDLTSIKEYNQKNGTRFSEESFKTPTEVLKLNSIRDLCRPYIPFLARSHLIKLNAGGFFPPHRDSFTSRSRVFRLFAALSHSQSDFCFLLDDQKLFFEPGVLYFVNTKQMHSLFSFFDNSIFLVLNVILNRDSVDTLLGNLAES